MPKNNYLYGTQYHVSYDYHDKSKNVEHYVRYMLDRSLTMFRYVNLPDTIPQKELEKLLQINGYACIAKVNGELYAFNGGFGGVGDVYNNPTQFTISNPFLNYYATLDIDKDCIIIKNDSEMLGLIPMYEKYCTILNESDISMILATINKRVQMLISANDDNTVASAKRYLQDIEDGKLGVIAETKLFDSLKVNNASTNNTSLRELYEMHQYIRACMYNEIGLGSNMNLKKEHVIQDEVEENTDNLYPLVDDMIDNRRIALNAVNKMFGTDIQIEFNSSWDYRVYMGESIDTLEGESETDVDGVSEIDTITTNDLENDKDYTVTSESAADETENEIEVTDLKINESEGDTDDGEETDESDENEETDESDKESDEETDRESDSTGERDEEKDRDRDEK